MRVKAVSIMGKKRETMCMAKQKESFMDATWLNERNKALIKAGEGRGYCRRSQVLRSTGGCFERDRKGSRFPVRKGIEAHRRAWRAFRDRSYIRGCETRSSAFYGALTF